ncbi:MAG: zf-HC2 domain-containing protein [Armatimonadetes bacterium]|nr:zf-HC2 domain-containing protein [Armatimonadota bacterium]
MECEQVIARLWAYLDGELDEATASTSLLLRYTYLDWDRRGLGKEEIWTLVRAQIFYSW